MILHYYEKGRRGDPVVLFIHGSASDATVWLNELNIVASRGFHCIALDLRGHGETRSLMQPLEHVKLDIDTHLDDVQETLDHLDIIRTRFNKDKDQEQWLTTDRAHKKIIIVTHSFGGMVAINIAERYPDLVDKLCLVCMPPKLIFPMKDILKFIVGKPLEIIQKNLEFFQFSPLRSRYKSSVTTNAHVLREIYKHVRTWNSFRKTARIHCQVHYAAGRFDLVAPVWLIYRMHQRTPGSTFELFKWSSHALMEDEPEKFRTWLLNCLSSDSKIETDVSILRSEL